MESTCDWDGKAGILCTPYQKKMRATALLILFLTNSKFFVTNTLLTRASSCAVSWYY